MELAAQILGVLAGFPEISLAILFGSAARNRLTPVSDIDIGVAAPRTLALERKLELHTALARVLPREVDLVDLQAVNGPILQQALSRGALEKFPFSLCGFDQKDVVQSGGYDAAYPDAFAKADPEICKWMKPLSC